MRSLILVALLIVAACAQPTPADFTADCTRDVQNRQFADHDRAWLTPESEARLRARLIQTCAETRVVTAGWDRQRRWAPIVAGVMEAASDSIVQHDFYVYRVPEARRYLARTR